MSPSALNSIIGKFMSPAACFHVIEFYLNGLKSDKKLGTVIEALEFRTTEIVDRFTAQLSDLQLICLFQAGQISRSQLELSPQSQFKDMIDNPMSLLRVYDLINERLMVRLRTLHALLANGIMDFLVAAKDQQADGGDENY